MADGLLIRIGADMQPALDAFKRVGDAAGNFATNIKGKVSGAFDGLGKAFSNIKSAASNAFAGATQAITSFINPTQLAIVAVTAVGAALLQWATRASTAEQAQTALNKAMDSGRASVQGEVADVRALVSIAKDESQSRETRLQALAKLNKEYPTGHFNVKLDKDLTNNLTKAEKELTDELIRQAQVKAQIKLIDDASLKKAQVKAAPLETLDWWDKLKIGVLSFTNTANLGANIVVTANERVNDTLRVQDAIIKGANEELVKLRKEQGKAGTLFTPPPAKAPKTPKELKEFDFVTPIKALKFDSVARDVHAKLTEPVNTDLATIGRELSTALDVKEALKKSFKDFKAFQESVKSLTIDLKSNILSGLGEALGEALAGGNIGDVFKGFLSVLADGMQQIGKAAIAYGISVKAILTAIKSLNPTVAIVAGIALVAAGAALKHVLNQKRFTEGGIVTGPTNAIVGEGGQPEVIFPLNKLNQFIRQVGGGGNQVFIVENRLEGTTIVQAYRRVTKQLGGTFS